MKVLLTVFRPSFKSAGDERYHSSDISPKKGLTRRCMDAFTQTSFGYFEREHAKQRIVTLEHYTASLKSWPRVYKSLQLIKDIEERCSDLECVLGLRKRLAYIANDLTEIDIYIDSSVKERPNSLLMKGSDIKKKETLILVMSEGCVLKTKGTRSAHLSGIYLDRKGLKLVENVSETHIHVTTDNMETQSPSEQSNPKIQISFVLERLVFGRLAIKCNILQDIREKRVPEGFKVDPKTFENNSSQCKDAIDQLLGEIISLFNRSTLPKNIRPEVKGFERKQVSKQVSDEIFKLDETIRGCGFERSTFVVNIEHSSDENENMERIKSFLKKHGIFDVKFNFVTKLISEYKQVGAEIGVGVNENSDKYFYGTVGSFASFTKADKTGLCALISKHLARQSELKKLYVKENDKMTEIGHIVEETLHDGGYDIAAAKILEEHMGQCEVQFKNSDNEPKPGILYMGKDSFELQDLHVHLWGAKTKPGRGIIRVPELVYRDVPETYIQIEDIKSSQRMAIEGDSGAIVCADDLDDESVHVISMLIGSNHETNARESSNAKRSYMTFPLQKGVEHLQNITDGTFELKGVTNK